MIIDEMKLKRTSSFRPMLLKNNEGGSDVREFESRCLKKGIKTIKKDDRKALKNFIISEERWREGCEVIVVE